MNPPILLPLDFSAASLGALKAALPLAELLKRPILLLHVVEDMGPGTAFYDAPTAGWSTLSQELVDAANQKLGRLVGDYKDSPVQVSGEVVVGVATRQIIEAALRWEAPMIVMGTHGASGMKELLVGSVTERIVRRSPVPVLSIPDECNTLIVNNIAVFSDFESKEEKTPILAELADALNVTLHLCRVITPSAFVHTRFARALMADFVKRNNIGAHSINIYAHTDLETGIGEQAAELHADIIALGTHGRRGLSHLVSGSLAEDIVNRSHRAILTYPID